MDYPLVNTTDNMMYRILYRSGNVFYIGGKGTFYRIDPHSTSCEIAVSIDHLTFVYTVCYDWV